MWDLIVLVPDHCLSFYFVPYMTTFEGAQFRKEHVYVMCSN